jgi:hypothetical protein
VSKERSPFRAALSAKFVATITEGLVKRDDLPDPDRDHLARWIKLHDHSRHDSMWEKVVADAHDLWPREGIPRSIIAYALHARQFAEAAKSGDDPIRQHNLQRRDQLLELAKKADELAEHFREVERYSGDAMFFQRWFLPVRSLSMFHEYEAKLLRQHAGREPQPTAFISRQRGGKGKRPREIGTFISLMIDRMNEICRKPHRDAIAAMTNAAFPKADVTAENINTVVAAMRRRSSP